MDEGILKKGFIDQKGGEDSLNLNKKEKIDIDLDELEIEELDFIDVELLDELDDNDNILELGDSEFLDESDDLKLTEEERNLYTEENLGLINHVAKKFSNTGIDEDELVAIALEGYVKALNKYRKNKKTKFTTYAYRCMFNEILGSLRKEKKWSENVTSLHAPIGTDKNGNTLDLEKVLKEDGAKELDEVVISKDVDALIIDSLSVLSNMEKYIIVHRFGIGGEEEQTQKVIATKLNISQAYVSKLEKDCLLKIRKYIQEEDLKNGVLGKNQYFNY